MLISANQYPFCVGDRSFHCCIRLQWLSQCHTFQVITSRTYFRQLKLTNTWAGDSSAMPTSLQLWLRGLHVNVPAVVQFYSPSSAVQMCYPLANTLPVYSDSVDSTLSRLPAAQPGMVGKICARCAGVSFPGSPRSPPNPRGSRWHHVTRRRQVTRRRCVTRCPHVSVTRDGCRCTARWPSHITVIEY